MNTSPKQTLCFLACLAVSFAALADVTPKEVLSLIDKWQSSHPNIAFKIDSIDSISASTQQVFWYSQNKSSGEADVEIKTRLERNGTVVDFYTYRTEQGDYVAYFPLINETVLFFGHSRMTDLKARMAVDRKSGKPLYKSADVEEKPQSITLTMKFDWDTLMGKASNVTPAGGESYIPRSLEMEWLTALDGRLLQTKCHTEDYDQISKIDYLVFDTTKDTSTYSKYFSELKKSVERNKKLSFTDAMRLATKEIRYQ